MPPRPRDPFGEQLLTIGNGDGILYLKYGNILSMNKRLSPIFNIVGTVIGNRFHINRFRQCAQLKYKINIARKYVSFTNY